MSMTTEEECLSSSSSDWTEDELSQVVRVRCEPKYSVKVRDFMLHPRSQGLTGTKGATAQITDPFDKGTKPKKF